MGLSPTSPLALTKTLAPLVLALVAVGCSPSMQTAAPDARPGRAPMTTDPMRVTTDAPQPAWAPNIDPQMWAVVDQLMSYGNVPYPQLTGFQARMEKTPTNAVMDLLHQTGVPPTEPKVTVSHREIPVGPEPGPPRPDVHAGRHDRPAPRRRLLPRRRLGHR